MADIKISEQWAGEPGKSEFKGYRKFTHGKMFTLGKDKGLAQRKAQALVVAAAALQAQGKEWSDESIQQALALATGTTVKSDAPAPKDDQSIDSCIERYKSHLAKTLLTTVEENGIKKTNGVEHYRSLVERLDVLKLALTQQNWKDHLDEQALKAANDKGEKGEAKRLIFQAAKDAQDAAVKALQAKQMNDLTEDDLLLLKAYLVRRPISYKTQKKLSVQYVTNLVHCAIRFLTHAEKRYGWQAPRHWIDDMKFARNQKKNMMSLAEQSAVNELKDHMTKEDLEFYWSAGTKLDKTFMGLAYWCAWTQVELATFRKVEFYLGDDKEYYIDKARSKTGKWGKWWVPKPIANLVIDAMARTTDDPVKNPDGLAFLTGNNLPLIHAGDEADPLKQKTDYVSTYSWGPIQRRSKSWAERNGRYHTFKWFRKTMAQRVKDISGNDHVSKAIMAQTINDVSSKYTNAMIEQSITAAKTHWEQIREVYEGKKKNAA